MVEKTEKLVENGVLKVDEVKVDGGSLIVEVSSSDREELVVKGRQFVIEHLGKTPEYNSWATAGVEPASGPMAFDPENPDADPYELVHEGEGSNRKWHYKQMFKLTKMI
jgi:hypothetical protein